DPDGRVLDRDRASRPWQVLPPACGELLVDLAAEGAARGASCRPAASDAQHHPHVLRDVVAREGHHSPALHVLEEHLLHAPPAVPKDLCKLSAALTHLPASWLLRNRETATALVRRRWVSALFDPSSRSTPPRTSH